MLRIKNIEAFRKFIVDFYVDSFKRAKNEKVAKTSVTFFAKQNKIDNQQALAAVRYLESINLVRKSNQTGRRGCPLYEWNLSKTNVNNSLIDQIIKNASTYKQASKAQETLKVVEAEIIHHRHIDEFTDQELVNILRERGWTIMAERQIIQTL